MGLPVGWRPASVSCCQHLLQLVQKLQSTLEGDFEQSGDYGLDRWRAARGEPLGAPQTASSC